MFQPYFILQLRGYHRKNEFICPMIIDKHTWLLIRVLLFSIGLFPTSFLAQEVFNYQGPLTIGPFSGEARYNYKVVEGDTLLDGSFTMERSNLDEMIEARDTSFVFSGNFKDGYPDDLWRFEIGDYQSERGSRMVDYQYRISVSGIQEQATGKLRLGRPTGAWEYLIQEIENSAVTKTLFRSQFEFQDGIPRGSFRIENTEGNLIGRFMGDGFAHDQWELFYTTEVDASQQWNFLDGILQNIQVTLDGETRVYEFFAKRISNEKIVPLDNTYLKALALYLPEGDTTDLSKLEIFKALSQNAENYAKLDGILSALGRSDFIPKYKVRLPHFPLDSQAQVLLDSLVIEVDQAREVSDQLLKDPQLNLLKLTDNPTRYAYASVEAIEKAYLKPLEAVVRDYRDSILQFIPLEEYIFDIWPTDKPTPTLEVPMPEGFAPRSFTGPGADGLDFSLNDLATLIQMGRYTSRSLDSIRLELSDKLSKNKRERELILLEEQMIRQDLRLNQLVDSLNQGTVKDIHDALGHIRETADAELLVYAGMQDEAAKLEKARELTTCLGEMEVLALEVSKLSEQQEEIKELYKDAVWNPFMAVIMEEEVKKRITTAHRKVLVPFLLNQISNDLGCDNVSALASLMPRLQARMLELRQEDTSRLERKLKREQDPIAILELFGFDPQNYTALR